MKFLSEFACMIFSYTSFTFPFATEKRQNLDTIYFIVKSKLVGLIFHLFEFYQLHGVPRSIEKLKKKEI